MKKLKFEQLPNEIAELKTEVREMKALLLQKLEPQPETDNWFDLNELCSYHPDKPRKPTVYGWINAGVIPVHKGGKKLRFLKSEIDDWLKQGRKKTLAETASEAAQFCKNK